IHWSQHGRGKHGHRSVRIHNITCTCNSWEPDSTAPSNGVDQHNDDNETPQPRRQRTPPSGGPRSSIHEIMARYHRISRDMDEYMQSQNSQENSAEGHGERRETPLALAESTRMAIERAEMLARSEPPDEQTLNQSGVNNSSVADDECSICFEVIPQAGALAVEPDDERHFLPCAHFFHHKCITQWLQNFGAVCPLCRRDPRRAGRELLGSPSSGEDSDSDSSTEDRNNGGGERIGLPPLLIALLLAARYPGLFLLLEDTLPAPMLDDLVRDDISLRPTPRSSVHEAVMANAGPAETMDAAGTTETNEYRQRPTCTICQSSMRLPNQEGSETVDDSTSSETSGHSEGAISTLPCTHSFHFACISTWLVESHSSWRRRRCPICRYELTLQETETILNPHIDSPQSTSTVLPNDGVDLHDMEMPSPPSPASHISSDDSLIADERLMPHIGSESRDENDIRAASRNDVHDSETDHSIDMLLDGDDTGHREASTSYNAPAAANLYPITSIGYPPLPHLLPRVDRDRHHESNTRPSPSSLWMPIGDVTLPVEPQPPTHLQTNDTTEVSDRLVSFSRFFEDLEATTRGPVVSPAQTGTRGEVNDPLRSATSDLPTGTVDRGSNVPNPITTTPLDLSRTLPSLPTEGPERYGQPGRAIRRPSISHRLITSAREPEEGMQASNPAPPISIPVRPPAVYSTEAPIPLVSIGRDTSHVRAQQSPIPEERHVITTQPHLTEQPHIPTPSSTAAPITRQPKLKKPMSMYTNKSYSKSTCDDCDGVCKAVVVCAPWLVGIGIAYGVYAFIRHVIQPAWSDVTAAQQLGNLFRLLRTDPVSQFGPNERNDSDETPGQPTRQDSERDIPHRILPSDVPRSNIHKIIAPYNKGFKEPDISNRPSILVLSVSRSLLRGDTWLVARAKSLNARDALHQNSLEVPEQFYMSKCIEEAYSEIYHLQNLAQLTALMLSSSLRDVILDWGHYSAWVPDVGSCMALIQPLGQSVVAILLTSGLEAVDFMPVDHIPDLAMFRE
ncbi:5260_t:CDS:2, partial [Acaulospora colombiana]